MNQSKDRDFEHFPLLSGRMNRSKYLMFIIASIIGTPVWLGIVDSMHFEVETTKWADRFFIGVFIYTIFWGTFRRAHDIGWWGITGIVPPMPILLLFIPGNEDANQYGNPPTDDPSPTLSPSDVLPDEIKPENTIVKNTTSDNTLKGRE